MLRFPKACAGLLVFVLLFCPGCGGGGADGSGNDFVYTGGSAPALNSRSLTFHFVRAQEALTVPADTTQIRFRFYSGGNGGGTLLQEELRDFANSITINPVNGATQSYVITAISPEGYPLLEVKAQLAAGVVDIDFNGSAPMEVTPQTLTLAPANSTIAIGQTVQFQPFVLFSNGETVVPAAQDVTWDATFQATIDANGLATGTADGVSTITSSFQSVTATANLVIGQGLLLSSLEVTPDNASVALDSDIPFAAAGLDQNGNPFSIDGLTLVWSATGDATIDSDTGLATGVSLIPNTLEGMATITATIGTISDSTNLTIIGLPGAIQSITTTPDPLNLNLDPTVTGTLTTTGTFENGPDQTLTNADNGLLYSVTGNPGVASVNTTTGEVTAIAQGTTEITATAVGQMDVVTVQVDFGAGGNQAPNIAVSATPVDLGGTSAAPVTAFPTASVSDDQASFVGGVLTIEAVAPGNQNVVIALPATPDIGTIQTNNAASVSVNLSLLARPAEVQEFLRAVTVFANSTGTAELVISLDDGQGQTGTASRSFVAASTSLTLAAGAHTYDTDTGALDGVVDPNRNGTRLAYSSFDLQAGATLTVTGSHALVVGVIGDAVIDGSIAASGGDAAGAAGNNNPGTPGAPGGPGGFAGGNGGVGGNNPGPINGQDGLGPGGGGGAIAAAGSAVDAVAGGGGAGHLNAGDSSMGQNGATGGQGGSAYLSIPGLLIGGSGGGGASAEVDGGFPEEDGGAGGGGGGGAVRITAFGTISVGGAIDCSGGDGGAGGGSSGGAGGGGSGGAIELLASIVPTVTGVLDVSGGLGGIRVTYPQTSGGNGSEGRINVGAF